MRVGNVKRKKTLGSVMVLFCALVVGACGGGDGGGGGSDDGASPASGGGGSRDTLTMAVQEIPTSLDLAVYQASAVTTQIATGASYLYLAPRSVEGTPVESFDPGKFVPGVAESWKRDGNGKGLTVTLRKGVKSPYGNELTTADIKWTVDRNSAIEGAIGGPFFYGVAGIDPEKPITVLDDYRFRFNLERTSPNLLRALNLPMVMPIDSTEAEKHATKGDPWAKKWLTANTAFFGPYNVSKFTPGQSLTLEANPNFYGEKPAISTIVIRAIPDPSTRQQLVQSGSVQFAPDIPRVQLERLQDDESVKVEYGRSSRILYVLMNTKVKPWDDARVRQAVAAVLPPEQMNEDAYRGTATVSSGPVSPLFGDHYPETWTHKTVDVEKGKKLMAEAGHSDGFSATLKYSLSNPGPENAQIAVVVQNALRQIGIDVKLEQVASDAAYFADLIEKKVAFGLGGTAAFIPDAGYALTNTSEGPSGFSDYTDPEFLKVVAEANSMEDGPERSALLKEAQAIWNRDVAMYPALEPNVGAAMAPDLNGFNIQSTGFPLLQRFLFGES